MIIKGVILVQNIQKYKCYYWGRGVLTNCCQFHFNEFKYQNYIPHCNLFSNNYYEIIKSKNTCNVFPMWFHSIPFQPSSLSLMSLSALEILHTSYKRMSATDTVPYQRGSTLLPFVMVPGMDGYGIGMIRYLSSIYIPVRRWVSR